VGLIPEWETDRLFFSELLKLNYANFFRSLEKLLRENGISFSLLRGTKDVWCRDYMPFQTKDGRFVMFMYDPPYLKGLPHLKTNQEKVTRVNNIFPVHKIPVILDGGHLVHSQKRLILSYKIFNWTKKKPEYLLEKIESAFPDVEVFVVSACGDVYGHLDWVVRFADENSILILNAPNCRLPEKTFKQLTFLPLNHSLLEIPFSHKFSWQYMNYIHIGNTIIVPTLGVREEEKILYQFENIFKTCKLLTLRMNISILRRGGSLHCISWNSKITS